MWIEQLCTKPRVCVTFAELTSTQKCLEECSHSVDGKKVYVRKVKKVTEVKKSSEMKTATGEGNDEDQKSLDIHVLFPKQAKISIETIVNNYCTFHNLDVLKVTSQLFLIITALTNLKMLL